MVAADVVDVDVDAGRGCLGRLRGQVTAAVVDGLVEAVVHDQAAGLVQAAGAEPMTLAAPGFFASWPATEPTAPAAPATKTTKTT
ncbi:hypothetical protein VT52_012420 [Streptomyces malaysiense]|uniref:Uncharacterized protein n=1 Tax=Streptomyces malaysiense TaxID=1428626 RepID=A0A1J4Q2B1_9ACTN|nr:hypothetical protein VT52_012420 [Streptomyces malaysiense]